MRIKNNKTIHRAVAVTKITDLKSCSRADKSMLKNRLLRQEIAQLKDELRAERMLKASEVTKLSEKKQKLQNLGNN